MSTASPTRVSTPTPLPIVFKSILNRLRTRASYAHLRPLPTFLGVSPNFSPLPNSYNFPLALPPRLKRNLSFYLTNYLLLFALILLFSASQLSLSHPFLLIVLGGAYAGLRKVKNGVTLVPEGAIIAIKGLLGEDMSTSGPHLLYDALR